jgi:HEAT repeat protein
MSKHVFISYHHDDGDFAEALINRIKKEGLETWVDNDQLYAGEDWRAEIDQAIVNSFAFIVIMTPEAKASEYVTYEWAFAWGAGVKVIPVVLKHTPLHPRLEALQYLDFTSYISRPWDKLIEVVKNAAIAMMSATSTKSNVVSEEHTYAVHVPSNAPTFIKQAIAKLDSANITDRIDAVDSLVQTTHPVAREALIAASQHPIQDVRINASLKLAPFDDTRAAAVSGLLEALGNEEDWQGRRSIVEALGKIGDAAAVPGLLGALGNDVDEDVRKSAAEALGKIGGAAAVPGLLKTLGNDVDEDVRKSAAEALGKIGDAAAVPGLLKALRNEDWNIRKSVASALGQIGDATAVPDLLKILPKAGVEVRKSIVEALGKIGKSSVSELLKALQNNQSWDVRRSAAEALGQIGDVTAVSGLLETLRNENERVYVRKSIIVALEKIGDATAVPDLLRFLHDKDEDLRLTATHALRQIGTPEALAAINEQQNE